MRNPIDADDLAQDAMLKAFRKIDQFQPGTDARAWLLSILRSTRIDRLRSRAHRKDLSLNEMPVEPATDSEGRNERTDAELSDSNVLLDQFADADVIQALQSLPEEIRWTLLLVDVEGLDHPSAAAILDVPVGTVKSRAHRGRSMLRSALDGKARELRLIR
jgi:RNA polymerase sigma-70 factor (ECF subfamily)